MERDGKERAAAAAEKALWERAFKRLVAWTIRKHRVNQADAEETVQEGIRLFLAAGGVADPADPRALLQALGSRVNGIMVNLRRKKAARAVELTADGVPAESADPPDEEARILNDDFARRAVSALLDRVEGDELVGAVVMQMLDGVEDAAAQAAALGRGVSDVYNARRRLITQADAVEKLLDGEGS